MKIVLPMLLSHRSQCAEVVDTVFANDFTLSVCLCLSSISFSNCMLLVLLCSILVLLQNSVNNYILPFAPMCADIYYFVFCLSFTRLPKMCIVRMCNEQNAVLLLLETCIYIYKNNWEESRNITELLIIEVTLFL